MVQIKRRLKYQDRKNFEEISVPASLEYTGDGIQRRRKFKKYAEDDEKEGSIDSENNVAAVVFHACRKHAGILRFPAFDGGSGAL